ncbi:MAG TPA: DNA adenine methylase [Chthoniobacterales bacterium]|nr:DNA adenine methylase [Chthoniobacterales bacterium]
MVGPLPYLGGKNRLARTIISLLPEHTTYVEPFCGGAQVLFHKEPSNVEILNDLNDEIFNFLRICQLHYEELLRQLKYSVVSRRWFELFERTPLETLTDVQRAARFLFLQKNCYGGLIVRRNFTVSIENGSNYNPKSLPSLIKRAHDRLSNVQLECLPYEKILQKCDRSTTFFYLDPPYFNRPYYRFNFEENDYVLLAVRLKRLKGQFLLSLNDAPEIRRIFADFEMRPLRISYSAQRRSGNRYRELLIANYDLPTSIAVTSA